MRYDCTGRCRWVSTTFADRLDKGQSQHGNLNNAELLARIEGHVIDEGKLVGFLRRGGGGSSSIASRPSHPKEAREVIEQGRLRLVLTLPERDNIELPDPGERTDVV